MSAHAVLPLVVLLRGMLRILLWVGMLLGVTTCRMARMHVMRRHWLLLLLLMGVMHPWRGILVLLMHPWRSVRVLLMGLVEGSLARVMVILLRVCRMTNERHL